MEHPSNPRADAAYERALAAYRDQSYDVARRWVGEALAHNKQHAGARALQARLDASRSPAGPFPETSSGPDVISTDPTVLISRASLSQPAADSIDPTIIASRADIRRRTDDTDAGRPAPFPAPKSRPMPAPAADQTVIAPAKARASSGQKAGFSLGAALQSLGQRVQGGQRPQRPAATSRGGSTASPAASRSGPSGALLAIGTVAVGALLVDCLAVHWQMDVAGRQGADDHEADRRHDRRPGHRVRHCRNAVLDDDRDGRSDRARDAPGQGLRLQRLHRRLRASRAHCDDGSPHLRRDLRSGRGTRGGGDVPAHHHQARRRDHRRSRRHPLRRERIDLLGRSSEWRTGDAESGRGRRLRLGAVHGRLPVDRGDGHDVGEDVRRDVHPQRGADQCRSAAVSDSGTAAASNAGAAPNARCSSANRRGGAAAGVRPDQSRWIAWRHADDNHGHADRSGQARGAAHQRGGAREAGDRPAREELLRRAGHAQTGDHSQPVSPRQRT